MSPQEQEHWEHVAGSFRSEHEAAYAQSRRETKIADQRAEIAALNAQGKFVVVEQHEVYCRHTDAILGVTNTIVSVHDTETEAIAAAGNVEEWGIARPQEFDANASTPASPDFTNVTENDSPF
jgi:hypothetical protein